MGAAHLHEALGAEEAADLGLVADRPLRGGPARAVEQGLLVGGEPQQRGEVACAARAGDSPSASASAWPSWDGRSITVAPASVSAPTFDGPLPRRPVTIAPAWPMRRPGGELRPAMNATTGVERSAMSSAASSSSAPPTSPTMTIASVPGSSSSRRTASRIVVPISGSPPMPMNIDWPSPARTTFRLINVPRLPLREITPIRPGWKTFGANAGMMPSETSPGTTRPAVLGPRTRTPRSAAAARISMVSWIGMCSVSSTTRRAPEAIASRQPALAASGGTNITAASTSWRRLASATLS